MHFDGNAAVATTLSSITVTQNTTSVYRGSIDSRGVSGGTCGTLEVIQIALNFTGGGVFQTIDQITCNTNGTTAVGDLSNAKLYYTGLSSTFSTATQFGSTIASPSGAMVFDGVDIGPTAAFTYYFWLTYDVSSTATVGNVIDAECTNAILLSGTVAAATPGAAGSRAITNIYSVSSTTDGTGTDGTSLRWAITESNLNVSTDLIQFVWPVVAVPISITTTLPAITDNSGVTINGWETGAVDGTPNSTAIFSGTLNQFYRTVLDNAGGLNTGLVISGNNTVIQGIVLQNFGDGTPSANDIAINITGNNNTVTGCYIGLGTDGSTKAANTFYGIYISGSSNTIGDGTAPGINLIAGMNNGAGGSAGIYITSPSTGNTIKGNIIGLQKDATNYPVYSSTATSTYQETGILLVTSTSNTIGGTASGDGNLISGNFLAGVYANSSSDDNTIIGNRIGTKWNGSTILTTGSQAYGIYNNTSYRNIIGGTTSTYRNIISANTTAGIYLIGGATGIQIKGNYIGLASDLSYITSNGQISGIYTQSTCTSVTIGGANTGEGNIITGNIDYGIYFNQGGSNNVYGNTIGTIPGATTSFASNQSNGIYLNSSSNNIIGGSSDGHRNVISDIKTSINAAVHLVGAACTGNSIMGNYIGPATDGLTYITSHVQTFGISLTTGASYNTIGGTNPGEGNVLSGNNSYGLAIGTSCTNNYVYGNIIGLQKNGLISIGTSTQQIGINLGGGASGNIIGGSTAAYRNIIAGNYKTGAAAHLNDGIYIAGTASGNFIRGNYIGVGSDGTTVPSPNQKHGIYFFGGGSNAGAGNIIGGTNAGEGNVISGNGIDGSTNGWGVYQNSPTGNASFYGNNIGLAADGTSLVTGNRYQRFGIYFANGSVNNTVGGTGNGKNTISGNNGCGLYITGGSTTVTTIKGNYIGIGTNGTSFITGNSQDTGVYISASAPIHTIGGTATGEGNVISGNSVYGVFLDRASNNIYGNVIGAKPSVATTLDATNNQAYGIYTNSVATTVIGGTASGYRNIISDNTNSGIYLTGASASSTVIKGNYIGTATNGTSFITGNSQDYGIYTFTNVVSLTVGGTNANEGNVISGNTNSGLYFSITGSHKIYQNIIGAAASGTTSLGSSNQLYGINFNRSSSNTIGGTSSLYRNIISDNTTAGLYVLDSRLNNIKGNYIGIATDGASNITSSSQNYGVYITGVSYQNNIGGTAAGELDVISGNYDGTTTSGAGVFTNSARTEGNTIIGNYIGATSTGSAWFTNNQVSGIEISSSPNNVIGGTTAAYRNVVSANGVKGIYITGASSTGNTITGNYLGLASNGSSFITSSDQDYGIYLTSSATSNTIGGIIEGSNNVISGNSSTGIYLNSAPANTVTGNIIGLQANATSLVSSAVQLFGITISSANNNIIGGTSSAERNIISGNTNAGVLFNGTETGNLIKGNYIGVGSDGAAHIATSTQDKGIGIIGLSSANTIGGTATGEGNLISGNSDGGTSGYGIYCSYISGLGGTIQTYTIVGNTIGPAANGSSLLTGSPIQEYGVYLNVGSATNLANFVIGGNIAGARNIISANTQYGVYLTGSGTTGNTIKGNYIGIASDGSSNITSSSQDYGIYLPSPGNTIGGNIGSGEQNTISANTGFGIYLYGTAASGNTIRGNVIGLNAAGTSFVTGSAQNNGIVITSNPSSNIIGGTLATHANTISGNGAGIIFSQQTANNTITGNIIGLQKGGAAGVASSNQGVGVFFDADATDITFGSTTTAERNIISGNTGYGIQIGNAGGADRTIIKGNYIGLASDGATVITTPSPQLIGIKLCDDCGANSIIGGTSSGERNIISGNVSGITFDATGAAPVTVKGNYIGPQADGMSNVSSNIQVTGIDLSAASYQTIGGSTTADANTISGNLTYGITSLCGACGLDGNIIIGNYIGGQAGTGNPITGAGQDYGIYFSPSFTNSIIGGSIGTQKNIISYNTADGIYIGDAGSTSNLITRNLIYGNTNKAINLNGAGNANYPSPTVNTNYTSTSCSGTATAGAIVEVFESVLSSSVTASAVCQSAEKYLGTATANGAGVWSLGIYVVAFSSRGTPIATARDASNNTSEFGCPSTAISLPIELLSFDAKKLNETSVKTYWQTASEINNDYFTVEASPDPSKGGGNWRTVGIVDGAGNSSSVISYEMLDNQLSQYSHLNTLYYRLKQTDFDGTPSYSNIVAVHFDDNSFSTFNIYPNPTSGDNINIYMSGELNEEVLIIVRDVLGKELYAKVFMINSNSVTIKLSDGFSLASGVYNITASSDEKMVSKKIVIR